MIIVPPTTTPRTRPEISSFVIATIEALGVPVPRSSRLRRMHDLFHSGSGTIPPDDPSYEVALESERDLQLLAFAFDQLSDFEPSEVYRELLKKLVSDSVLPQEDKSETPGRDAAFEIYVGAVCIAAKLLPVRYEEPDVSCVLDGTKYGFAVKRLKSLGQVQKRVRDATRQIRKSGLPGLIVLDLARAFNPANHRIRPMDDALFWSEYQANFNVSWGEHQPNVQEIMARANVLGIVVHDYHIRQMEGDWQLAGMTVRIPAENRSRTDQAEFKKLSALYTYGLPNQSDGSNQSPVT